MQRYGRYTHVSVYTVYTGYSILEYVNSSMTRIYSTAAAASAVTGAVLMPRFNIFFGDSVNVRGLHEFSEKIWSRGCPF